MALQLVERALQGEGQSPPLSSVDRKSYIQMFVRLRLVFQSKAEHDGEFWKWVSTNLLDLSFIGPDHLESGVILIPLEVIRDVHDFDAFAKAGGLERYDC